MVISERGFSLVEMLMSTAISGIVFLAVIYIWTMSNRDQLAFEKDAFDRIEFEIGRKQVVNLLQSSDMMHFAYTGVSGKKRLFRFVTPFPDRCADLTTDSECEKTTAYLSVKYSNNKNLIANFYCWFDQSKNQLIADKQIFTDLSAQGIGTPPFLVGISQPPQSLIWMVSNVEAVSISDDLTGAPLSDECTSTMPKNGLGRYDQNLFSLVTLQPFVPNFAEEAPYALGDELQDLQAFPLLFQFAEMTSFGFKPGVGAEREFAFYKCKTDAAMTVSCPNKIFGVSMVESILIGERFSLSLGGNPKETTMYSISSDSTKVHSSCLAPYCLPMYLSTTAQANIPLHATVSENFEDLNATNFSFLKQEILIGLTLKVFFTTGKSYEFTVPM